MVVSNCEAKDTFEQMERMAVGPRNAAREMRGEGWILEERGTGSMELVLSTMEMGLKWRLWLEWRGEIDCS